MTVVFDPGSHLDEKSSDLFVHFSKEEPLIFFSSRS